MKKYLPLYNYLKGCNDEHLKLQFKDIENIISDKLPNSASQYRAWWANGGHIQADAWLEAGWEVGSVELDDFVEFRKKYTKSSL